MKSRPGVKELAARPSEPEVILLAATGMSPAVITETVWALAQENPSVIPDRVIAITTSLGRESIARELFSPQADFRGKTVWSALRDAVLTRSAHQGKLRFGTTGDDIRVFTSGGGDGHSCELADICTPGENKAAADFILETLRGLLHHPDTRLIVSIAGGRKTMGALLYACMSLLGRAEDRITHVLVNEPFENPSLQPRFYFPCRGVRHHLRDKSGRVLSTHNSSSAKLQLADVPFVRLRQLFSRELGRYPGRFSALVELYSNRVEEIGALPEVFLHPEELVLEVNGRRIELDFREWCTYAYFIDRLKRGLPDHVAQKHQENDLQEFLQRSAQARKKFTSGGQKDWHGATIEDLRRKLSTLRRKLILEGFQGSLHYLLPTRRRFGIQVNHRDQKQQA